MTTENPQEVLISTGDTFVRGVDFGIRRLSTSPAALAAPGTSTTSSTPNAKPADPFLISDDAADITSAAIRRYWDGLAVRAKGFFMDDGA